jgi:serine phosphatase RsbU (regulator of sigma subunit)
MTNSNAPQDSYNRSELSIARTIQKAMVPSRLPAMEGVELASLYLPSEQLGGDLYDVIQIGEDVIAVTVFDVASNGIPAALLASLAKVSFANHVRQVSSPRAVMERVNDEMLRSVSARYYITALVAYLDLHDNKLTYCNAGHPYPIIVRNGASSVEPIKSTGGCVGLFEKGQFEEKSLYLNPGDWLVFFTDGLYQLFGEENELANRKVLESEVLSCAAKGSPEMFVTQLRDRYDATPSSQRGDDVTVLAIDFLTQSRKSLIK